MLQIATASEQSAWSREQQAQGKRIAFVPTMGALHEGHVALIKRAKALGDLVVVSIYLNPTQFDDPSDLEQYPSSLAGDLEICEAEAVDVVFMPDNAVMYPDGFATFVEVVGPLSDKLCGMARPGHFRGVCTVVTKLFNIVRPDIAVFGQKDLQQVLIIARMVGDLALPVTIETVPTVREADGLALSSRNRRLSAAAREIAGSLPLGLNKAGRAFKAGERSSMRLIELLAQELLVHEGVDLDYANVIDGSFAEVDDATTGCLLAVAVIIDGIRLIDHIHLGGDDIPGAEPDIEMDVEA